MEVIKIRLKYLLLMAVTFIGSLVSAQDSTLYMSLSECVSYGKTHAVSQQLAKSDIETAKQDVKEVKSIGLPQINAGANFTHNLDIATQVLPDFISPSVYGVLYNEGVINPATNPIPSFGSNPVQFGVPYQFTASASLRQLIFDGTYFLGLKAANEYVKMSELQAQKQEVDLTESISKSYLLILTTKENKSLVESNLTIVEDNLKQANALYANGFAEKLDVERIELSKSNLDIRLASISRQLDILHQSLKLSMGMDVNTPLILTDSLKGLLLANAQVNASLDLKNLPDYQILKQNQTLQELNLKSYKVGRYPNVSLNALYGQQSFGNAGDFAGVTKDFFPISNYQVSVNIPIWDGNRRRAQMAKVEQNLEKNSIQLAGLENAAKLNFNAATNSYNTALQLLDLQQKNLGIAKAIFKKASLKFKEGLGSSLELSQAETDYKAAQVSYLNSVYDVLIANLELQKATGQLNK
jgi:outer membrane protein TolC